MKTRYFTYIVAVFFISCCVGIFSFTSQLYANENPPISITADEMISTQKTNTVTFKGDVDAKQGDLQIRSDQMIVFYSAADKKNSDQKDVSQQVSKIVCEGNVEITKDDWLGTSKKMTYKAKEKEILLTDNAKFWQGQNMVSGDKIIYYIDEGRSEVLSGDEPINAVIDNTKPKKKKRVKMTIIQ